MPRIAMDVSKEEYEILKQKKEELSLTWEDALIKGLAIGPTPIEKLGFPDPLKELAQTPSRDEEFLKKLENANE